MSGMAGPWGSRYIVQRTVRQDGRYEILEGVDTWFERPVRIHRFFDLPALQDPGARREVEQYALSLTRRHAVGVAPWMDHRVTEEACWLVQVLPASDYLLWDRATGWARHETERRRLVHGVSQAVSNLHRQDALHGCLTPSRIAVSGHRVTLLDWGLWFIADRLGCDVYTTEDRRFLTQAGWTGYVDRSLDVRALRTLLFGVYVPTADLPDDPRALRAYEETFPGHVLAWMQAAWHGDHAAHGLLDGLEIEGEVPQGRDRPGRPREALADRWGSLIALEWALLGQRTLALPYRSWSPVNEGSHGAFQLAPGAWVSDDEFWNPGATVLVRSRNRQIAAHGVIASVSGDQVQVHFDAATALSQIPPAGSLGPDLRGTEAVLHRSERILRDVRYRQLHNPRLEDVLEALPDPPVPRDPARVQETYQPLNEGQRRALGKALATESIFVLQGPPGTGKTTWITELVLQILTAHPTSRILIASQSNVALDHALSSIRAVWERHQDRLPPRPRLIRLGDEGRVMPSHHDLILERVAPRWAQSVRASSVDGVWALQATAGVRSEVVDAHMALLDVLESSDLGASFLELSEPVILAATCMGSYRLRDLPEPFDWVIVDEAGRATPPEALIPLDAGRRMVLVGDHRQLPPVVDQAVMEAAYERLGLTRSDIERSLFQDLFDTLPDAARETLTLQYRMPPLVADLISQLFYEATPLSTPTGELASNLPLPALSWITTAGVGDPSERRRGTSFDNPAEAHVIVERLEWLERQVTGGQELSVAVIAGYRAQAALIEDRLATRRLEHLRVEVDTVDAFQGREADLVFYSLVRSNRQGRLGFLKDERRLNVAFSRARRALVIVGNHETATVTERTIFARVFEYIRRHPHGAAIMEA